MGLLCCYVIFVTLSSDQLDLVEDSRSCIPLLTNIELSILRFQLCLESSNPEHFTIERKVPFKT
jgi:hypothetical protein